MVYLVMTLNLGDRMVEIYAKILELSMVIEGNCLISYAGLRTAKITVNISGIGSFNELCLWYSKKATHPL